MCIVIAIIIHIMCHVKSIDSANVEFTGSVSDLVERPVGLFLSVLLISLPVSSP